MGHNIIPGIGDNIILGRGNNIVPGMSDSIILDSGPTLYLAWGQHCTRHGDDIILGMGTKLTLY